MITNYSKNDFNMLLGVSYELLKIEYEFKDYSIVDNLLCGCVKPDILRELIQSNHYNPVTKTVKPKKDKFFRLAVGADSKLL